MRLGCEDGKSFFLASRDREFDADAARLAYRTTPQSYSFPTLLSDLPFGSAPPLAGDRLVSFESRTSLRNIILSFLSSREYSLFSQTNP